MKLKLWLLGLALPLIPLFAEDALKLQITHSQNLVQNADFSQLKDNQLPVNWYFDNCSKSPHFRTTVVNDPSGNYLAVNTEWNKFGYWLQNIPVKEGVYYYVSCEVQSDNPAVALWIMANAKKTATVKSPGNIRYFISMATRHGEDRKQLLKDFIDENLIPTLSPTQWYRISQEVIFPLDRGIEVCAMRFGIYGGYAGQGRFRNPVFREAKAELKVEVVGTGWQEIYIKGAQPERVQVNPDSEKQSFVFILPRAKHIYQVVLSGKDGKKITREIANE